MVQFYFSIFVNRSNEQGVKTETSDKAVTQKWVDLHLEIGIKAMTDIGQSGEEIKHFKY